MTGAEAGKDVQQEEEQQHTRQTKRLRKSLGDGVPTSPGVMLSGKGKNTAKAEQTARR